MKLFELISIKAPYGIITCRAEIKIEKDCITVAKSFSDRLGKVYKTILNNPNPEIKAYLIENGFTVDNIDYARLKFSSIEKKFNEQGTGKQPTHKFMNMSEVISTNEKVKARIEEFTKKHEREPNLVVSQETSQCEVFILCSECEEKYNCIYTELQDGCELGLRTPKDEMEDEDDYTFISCDDDKSCQLCKETGCDFYTSKE